MNFDKQKLLNWSWLILPTNKVKKKVDGGRFNAKLFFRISSLLLNELWMNFELNRYC